MLIMIENKPNCAKRVPSIMGIKLSKGLHQQQHVFVLCFIVTLCVELVPLLDSHFVDRRRYFEER